MTFSSDLTITRNRIRLLAGDTSNDVATEAYADDVYDATIALYTNWKRAAVDMLGAVAAVYDSRPTGLSADGDGSLSWGERAKQLRATAARLQAEADEEDAGANGVGQMISVRSRYMAGRPA